MKTLIINRKIIVSILTVILLTYSVQGVSYAQDDVLPGGEGTLFSVGETLVVTPGETNTSLKVSFIDRFFEPNKRAYQVQLRRKDPQGDWILKCDTIPGWLVPRPSFDEHLSVLFTDLEPGTTYEARWRETNEAACFENPPNPNEWSSIREGTTLLETPPRVEFADTTLAIAVRLTLGLDIIDGIDILKIPEEQLTQLTTLFLAYRTILYEELEELRPYRLSSEHLDLDLPEISSLTGLEHATQLRSLTLRIENISDISPLAELTELRELDLWKNQIRDISPLAALTELRELDLRENQIRDISPLAQLTQLTLLELNENWISDVTALANLTELRTLWLIGNRISDISPLAQLADASLTNLNLSRNQIRDVTPLAHLTNLTQLSIGGNNISDATPLTQLANLETLYLAENQIRDIPSLAQLTSLETLSLSNNQIRDVTPFTQLADASLTNLNLNGNQIRDVTPLAQLTNLETLILAHNQIRDVTPLAQLADASLTNLDLGGNQIQDVSPLADLTYLESLRLSGNPIADTFPLSALLDANPDIYIDIDIADIAKFPIREEGGPTIYWTEEMGNSYIIRRVDLANGQYQDVVTLSELPEDITIDTLGGKIYWCSESTIKRANLDGTDIQLVAGGLDSVTGIYLDVAGGKIYWLDEGEDKIQRANLDGTNVEDLITGLSNDPLDLAVDVSEGKIYWTYRYGEIKIRRADLDGANVEDLITVTGRSRPVEIAIDVSGGKMYWFDEGQDKIQRANLDGTDIKDIASEVSDGDIALDVPGGKIYWADYYEEKIQRANLDGTNVEDVVTGLTDLSGIALATSTGEMNLPSTTPETPATTGATVSISPASVASPAVGDQLEFSLNITSGEAVAGYQATVQFDTTALRYVSGANGDFLPAGAFFVQPKVEGNLVKLNAASLAGESNGDGTLATLTFEVIAVKASTLTLSDALLTDNTGSTSVPNVETAEITGPTGLKGDVNGDGTVNIADLVLVASNLGKTGQNAADVNGDGMVNIADLVLVAGALGTSATAPSLHPQVLGTLTAADVKQWLSQAQQLNLTDTTSQRGILFLQQLLIALTPKETALLANYPNPFNPETWIPYHLAKEANVTLHIYAMNGTLVRTLTLGHQAAGMYQNRSRAAYWDGKNALGEPVASGVYFYTLTAGDFTATRKMLIRK